MSPGDGQGAITPPREPDGPDTAPRRETTARTRWLVWLVATATLGALGMVGAATWGLAGASAWLAGPLVWAAIVIWNARSVSPTRARSAERRRDSRPARATAPETSHVDHRAWGWPLAFTTGVAVWALAGRFIVKGVETIPGVATRLDSLKASIPPATPTGWAVLAAMLATSAIASFLLGRVLAGGSLSNEDAAADAFARWARWIGWWSATGAVFTTAFALGRPLADGELGTAASIGTVVLLVEATWVALADAWAARTLPARGWLAVLDGPLLRWTLSRANPLLAPLARLTEQFGIDVPRAWALQFVRRALPRVAAALVVVGWLSTALQQVGVDEQALHLRLGRQVRDSPLESGLHVVLPWPVDEVRRAPTRRTLQLTLGYRGETLDDSLLWTSRHAVDESTLLLGDGNDLVAINGVLSWRIADIEAHLLGHQNPRQTLAALADRVLLLATHGKTLDGVLSENLAEFATTIERDLQREVDARDLGIEIVDLALVGLHPPVDVAPDYQAVVAALVERDTFIIDSEAYRAEVLPDAEAEALTSIAGARGTSVERLGQATGEAAAFDAIEDGRRLSPELFEFRRKLETLEALLAERSFVVVDERIERDGASLWVLD